MAYDDELSGAVSSPSCGVPEGCTDPEVSTRLAESANVSPADSGIEFPTADVASGLCVATGGASVVVPGTGDGGGVAECDSVSDNVLVDALANESPEEEVGAQPIRTTPGTMYEIRPRMALSV